MPRQSRNRVFRDWAGVPYVFCRKNVMVRTVIEHLRAGESMEKAAKELGITEDDVRAAIAFAVKGGWIG